MKEIPARFFGPVNYTDADAISELVLESQHLRISLIAFMIGEIDARGLAYDLQSLMEEIERVMKQDRLESLREMPYSHEAWGEK